MVGALERWEKWSFPLRADGPGITDLDGGPESWIRVDKYRWLLEADGCEVELVEIDARGRRSWSLAAEATGSGHQGFEALVTALRQLTATGLPPITLAAERSYGYARLLAS